MYSYGPYVVMTHMQLWPICSYGTDVVRRRADVEHEVGVGDALASVQGVDLFLAIFFGARRRRTPRGEIESGWGQRRV